MNKQEIKENIESVYQPYSDQEFSKQLNRTIDWYNICLLHNWDELANKADRKCDMLMDWYKREHGQEL